jgi:LacI family transcriptional regulator
MAASDKGRRPREAATLADVGREAGVSEMAASAVLNGSKTSARISAETRARVLAVAERLRYRPNLTARALAHRRMNTIGVVAHLPGDDPNLYFLEVFSGIVRSAAAAGQSTTVFTLDGWHEAPQRIPVFCDGRVDGLIVLAPLLSDDGSAWLPGHTPIVSVHANHLLAGASNLECDEEAGAFAAVRHMLRLGHRRILHVGGPVGSVGADRREAGYLRAHAAASVRPPEDGVMRGAFAAEAGRSALRAWLKRHANEPPPDAVFGANDAIALGCMEVLQDSGLRVPGDVSVVGFDDTMLARTARLATVHQPLREMGHRAVQILLERIEARRRGGADSEPQNIVLPTEFVPATSLAPRRAAAPKVG